MLHAHVQATLHNAHFPCRCSGCQMRAKTSSEDHHDPWTWRDFMPGATPRGRRQTWRDQMAAFASYVEAQNGRPQEPAPEGLTMAERIERARERYRPNG